MGTAISRQGKNQPVRKAATPPVAVANGPVFITPVTVASGTTSSGGWVTYNAAVDIPTSAKAVILDAAITSAGGANMEMLIRPSNIGYNLRLCSALSPSIASGSGVFPLTSQNSVRSFDYQMTGGHAAASWDLRIIGYFL